MANETSFPFFIHMITIPMTLGLGFLWGWALRARAFRRTPRRPLPSSPGASPTPAAPDPGRKRGA